MRSRRRARGIAFVLLACVASACSGSSSAAHSVVLIWDPVRDSNLAGYRVYYGTAPGSYARPGLSIGNYTAYELKGLKRKTTYHFAVTAYDYLGNESAFSNEVTKTFP